MHLEQEDRPHIMRSPPRSLCGGGGGDVAPELDFLLNCTVIASTRSSYDVECCILMVISHSQLTLVQETRFESDI